MHMPRSSNEVRTIAQRALRRFRARSQGGFTTPARSVDGSSDPRGLYRRIALCNGGVCNTALRVDANRDGIAGSPLLRTSLHHQIIVDLIDAVIEANTLRSVGSAFDVSRGARWS